MQNNKFRRVIVEKLPHAYAFKSVYSGGMAWQWRDKLGNLHRDGNEPAEMHSSGHCFFYTHGLHTKSENRSTIEEQIEEIKTRFDFESVKKVMKLLGWRWGGSNETPTIEQIQKTASRMMLSAYEDCYQSNSEERFVSCGGLKATYYRDCGFSLEFIVDQWDTFP